MRNLPKGNFLSPAKEIYVLSHATMKFHVNLRVKHIKTNQKMDEGLPSLEATEESVKSRTDRYNFHLLQDFNGNIIMHRYDVKYMMHRYM